MNFFKIALSITGLAAISACGGASTSSGNIANYTSQFANLQTAQATSGAMFTPEADLPTAATTYTGVVNVGFAPSTSSFNAYLGALEVDVNFAGNTLSGTINDFASYSVSGLSSVSGSVDITSGVLTGNNTGIGDGLTASADGTIDGQNVDWDVTGHFSGDNAEIIGLYFDGPGFGEGGVGLATR